MFTQSPEITIDASVGQVVSQPTSTPSPTSTASPVSTDPTSTPLYTFPPFRRYRDNALIIYGYGPINSAVTLKGFGVSEETASDETGLFVFNRIYSLTLTYPELCVQSVDNQNRVTQPSCIPALPNTSLIPLEVGPILLSPTVSLSENRVVEGANALMSGNTTPNTLVNIYFSKMNGLSLSLISEVNAYNLPVINTTSDDQGRFEISLPTSAKSEYRIFASTKYGEDLSAKSNTLRFSVITDIKSLWERLLDYLIKNKIMTAILIEAVIIVWLLILSLKSTTKPKQRHSESDYLEGLKVMS